jgi:hypothetical protein
MTHRKQGLLAASAALALALAATGPALAQGTTSGPAAGGNVKPSATTQKGNAAGHGGSDSAKSGDVSTGGVGVEAKKGTESGPAPTTKNNTR